MLVILKCTAPAEASREWPSAVAFVRGTQDATVTTNYKNAIAHTPKAFRSIRWMKADNKTMIHIIIGKQAWWNSEWTNYFEPTIAAGKLAVEKLVEEQISLPTTNAGDIDWNNVATSTAGAEMEKLIEGLGADWKDSDNEGAFDWTQFEEWPSNFPTA